MCSTLTAKYTARGHVIRGLSDYWLLGNLTCGLCEYWMMGNPTCGLSEYWMLGNPRVGSVSIGCWVAPVGKLSNYQTIRILDVVTQHVDHVSAAL